MHASEHPPYPLTLSLAKPRTLVKNSPEALVLIWSMVTTHDKWLASDNLGDGAPHHISVPYDEIDSALNLDSGLTKSVWNVARASRDVFNTATLFQCKFMNPTNCGGTAPDPVPGSNGWPDDGCKTVGDYVTILNPGIDPDMFPSVRYID